MEVLQSPFLTQFRWSTGSSICFLLQGAAVCALGVQPTLTLELGMPVSTVSLVGTLVTLTCSSITGVSYRLHFTQFHSLTAGLRWAQRISSSPQLYTLVRSWSVGGREPCGGPAVTIPYTVSLVQWIKRLLPDIGGSGCAPGVQPTLTGTGNAC